MSEHSARHTEQYNAAVIVAVLSVPFPFPGRDNQSPFSVEGSDTKLPQTRQLSRAGGQEPSFP